MKHLAIINSSKPFHIEDFENIKLIYKHKTSRLSYDSYTEYEKSLWDGADRNSHCVMLTGFFVMF